MTATCFIASYRYGHLAAHCIESVLAQTVPFTRVVFVDDGAGDCGHLPAIYPEVEFILRPENLGIVPNFADLLERAETERMMILGADNWLRADALFHLSVPTADIVSYDICITGDRVDNMPTFCRMHPCHDGYVWDRSQGHHGSMLYDPEKARQAGGYEALPRNPKSCEDFVLYRRMTMAGATRAHVAQPLLYYRRHRTNFQGD